MVYKEFPYYIAPKFKKKLDLLIDNLKKNDVWLIIDGDEGSGKTNTATYIMYYVHCMTGREFTLDRFYFDSEAMFEWVKSNDNGLINWDEASLGGLSAEWWNKSQRNLLKFAMTGRKKHHFFVLCIPKMKKLTEYLRLDRSHALIHMDLGKKRNKYGSAMYLTRRGKSHLSQLWTKKKIMAYGSCMRKYGGFGFYIPYIFPKVLNEDEYEKKKDIAIDSIGKGKDNAYVVKLNKLQHKIACLPEKDKLFTFKYLSEYLGVTDETLRNWRRLNIPVESESQKSN